MFKGRGTDTSVVQMRQALEAGENLDALPKPLLVFSWIRMGMPADFEEYLVAMNWGGHSLVRSPLVMSTVVEEA